MAQANPQSQQTLELPAGTHWICSCGQSKKLPYCDGSHRGTDFRPIALELAAPSTVDISGSVNAQAAS